jgi:hypothetical protein
VAIVIKASQRALPIHITVLRLVQLLTLHYHLLDIAIVMDTYRIGDRCWLTDLLYRHPVIFLELFRLSKRPCVPFDEDHEPLSVLRLIVFLQNSILHVGVVLEASVLEAYLVCDDEGLLRVVADRCRVLESLLKLLGVPTPGCLLLEAFENRLPFS